MLTIQTCKSCKGIGMVQKLEEQGQDGDWHHNTMLPHHIADAWIANDPHGPLRWTDIPCPTCDGVGIYDVEFVKCKIF